MKTFYALLGVVIVLVTAVFALVYFSGGGDREGNGVLADYTEVPVPDDALVIAMFGQSNIGNHVRPKYDGEIPRNLLQFDWRSGKVFKYREPLLGTTWINGNSLTPFFVRLANEVDRPVVAVPFASANSSVLEWAYGRLGALQGHVFDRVKSAGLSIDMFLWHQGERDAGTIDDAADLDDVPYFNAITPAVRIGLEVGDYEAALTRVINRSRAAFPSASFGIALVSRGYDGIDEKIREAQNRVASSFPFAFVTADADRIHGDEYRHDGLHLSQAGARKVSEQYAETVIPRLVD